MIDVWSRLTDDLIESSDKSKEVIEKVKGCWFLDPI